MDGNHSINYNKLTKREMHDIIRKVNHGDAYKEFIVCIRDSMKSDDFDKDGWIEYAELALDGISVVQHEQHKMKV